MACVYYDNSSKGVNKYGRTTYHNCYRAEYSENGKRYRKRFKFKQDAEQWAQLNHQLNAKS